MSSRAALRRTANDIRFRTLAVVAVGALLLLSAAAAVARERVYADRLAATRSLAEIEVDLILTAIEDGAQISGDWGALPYELLAGDGVLVASSTDLGPYEVDGRPLMPAPGDGPAQSLYRQWPVTFPERTPSELAGRSMVAVDGTIPASTVTAGGLSQEIKPSALYRVYVFVTPFSAEAAARQVDPYLLAGVPLIALLLSVAAGWIVHRSLKPVEAIRAQTAELTAANLHRRIPVPDSTDPIAALAVTINDTLARLEDAVTRQQNFTADAAHELRSPLTTLLATVQVAQAYPESADYPDLLDRIHRGARRLQILTEDLLLLARPDGIEPLRHQSVELRALIGPLLSGPASLEPGDPVRVTGDPNDLERAVRNLLENATWHARTRVVVSVAAEKNTARVTVDNDGPPVPAADQQRIFDRFVRLDAARSRDQGGFGLGLAIVREIAGRHRGDAHSVPCDQGARFVIDLPLQAAPAPSPGDGHA